MKIIPVLFLFLIALCLPVFAASEDEVPAEVQAENGEDQGTTCVQSDRDKDGLTDYLIRMDDVGTKVYEELDFNYDGAMDDFYFYSSGILCRREIDTNYDQQVDVWVYIHEGIYIERYERDLDFDGTVDLIKDFSETESAAPAAM